jgi:hypothetical protein
MNNRLPPQGNQGRQPFRPYYGRPSAPLRQWNYDGPNAWYSNQTGSFFPYLNQVGNIPNQGNHASRFAARFEPPLPYENATNHAPNAAPRSPLYPYARPFPNYQSHGISSHASLPNQDSVPPPPNQNSVPPPQVCCCHDANDSNHACCPVDSTNPPSDPEIHSRNIPKDELRRNTVDSYPTLNYSTQLKMLCII